MAIVANTYTRYDAKGLREQLTEVISNISPEETPVYSMAGRGSMDQTLKEWQTDALATVDSANKHLEGDDITSFPAVTPTTRVGNYAQISRKLVIVSRTLDRVSKAGRDRELSYQIAKRGRELKRDFETIITENLGGDGGGTATPRQTATLGAWIKTNTSFGVGGGDPTYTSGVPGAGRTDGTQRAFTETIAKTVLQSCFTEGAEPRWLVVGPHNKQVVSGFNSEVIRNYDISNPKPSAIITAMDVFVHDFGVIKVRPNRFQRERDAWFLDPEFLAIDFLDPIQTVELAKSGDAEKRMLIVEWSLRVTNEAALGLGADLLTA